MSIKQNDCYIDRSQNISQKYMKYNFFRKINDLEPKKIWDTP